MRLCLPQISKILFLEEQRKVQKKINVSVLSSKYEECNKNTKSEKLSLTQSMIIARGINIIKDKS